MVSYLIIIDEILVELQLIGTVLLVLLPVVVVLLGVVRHPLLLLHLVLVQALAVIVNLPARQQKSDPKTPPGEKISSGEIKGFEVHL